MKEIKSLVIEKKEEIVNKLNTLLKEIDPDLEIDQIRFVHEKRVKCRWVIRKYTYNGKTYTRLVRVCE